MITQEKKDGLEEALNELGIYEKDLSYSFSRPSGKGGQKMQKTSSKVQITHIPTNITVQSQKTRSKEDNTFFAKRLLLERYKEEILHIPNREHAKIQKQKQKRKQRAKKRTDTD